MEEMEEVEEMSRDRGRMEGEGRTSRGGMNKGRMEE